MKVLFWETNDGNRDSLPVFSLLYVWKYSPIDFMVNGWPMNSSNDTGETILGPITSTGKIGRREQCKQFGMFRIEWNKKDGLKWEKARYEKEGSQRHGRHLFLQEPCHESHRHRSLKLSHFLLSGLSLSETRISSFSLSLSLAFISSLFQGWKYQLILFALFNPFPQFNPLPPFLQFFLFQWLLRHDLLVQYLFWRKSGWL